jgi:DNA-binding HxlR family transcriptional regulator
VRSLDVIGEKWTLLIVRNAFRGQTRYSEFLDGLGIPSDILSARLRTLVEAGIFETRDYRDVGSRPRKSYHLTEAGRDLAVVMAALQQWGDTHRPTGYGPASVMVTASDAPARLVIVDQDARELTPADVHLVPGPGASMIW